MKALFYLLPAWLLNHLPVRIARQAAAAVNLVQQVSGASHAAKSHKQLLVDVSVIYRNDARTGIQRVVRALLLQLLACPPAGYAVCPIYAARHHGYRYAKPVFLTQPQLLANEANVDASVTVGAEDVFLGLDLAAHLLPRHSAQVLGWKRAGVKVHLLVYDLLPLLNPEWFSAKTRRNFKRWIKWLATYADSAICISDTVRTDLADWLHSQLSLPFGALPSKRISLGGDIASTAPSLGISACAEITLARMRATTSLLMVGTLEPRKGHDQVLTAFDELQQRSADASAHGQALALLVIVGRPGWKTEALQQKIRNHPQAGKQVVWFEQASDDLLQQLYSACTAVIVASRGEGFGLPLVEAAMHGKPIIARDLPAFRELNLQNIVYFHGDSPAVLAGVIQASLGSRQCMAAITPAPFTWVQAGLELQAALALPSACEQRVSA